MLKINGLQPVEIGGKVLTPNVNTEARLRIQASGYKTAAESESTDALIADCFGEDAEFVKATLQTAPLQEKQILRAYLISGERGVQMIEAAIQQAVAESLKAANIGGQENA